MQAWKKYPIWKVPDFTLGLESFQSLCLPSTSDSVATPRRQQTYAFPGQQLRTFMETKQQKRAFKEEKMGGQIVEELSSWSLTNSDIKKDLSRPQKPQLVRDRAASEPKDGLVSGSSSFSSLSPPPHRAPSLFQRALKGACHARLPTSWGRSLSSGPRKAKESSDRAGH